jgi:hypothetical protein
MYCHYDFIKVVTHKLWYVKDFMNGHILEGSTCQAQLVF